MFNAKVTWICLFFTYLQIASMSSMSDDTFESADSSNKTNGCGSGWNTWLVPDSIPVLECKFNEACNKHDLCYGKCEKYPQDHIQPECEYLRCKKGGDLYQSNKCDTDVHLTKLITDAKTRKSKCDDSLYNDINNNNPGKAVCRSVAIVYKLAVKNWGEGSFHGITATGETINQPKSEYDGAIKDFFKYGTKEQFEAFVQAYDKGNVNLEKPLQFDKTLGLHEKYK